MELDRSYDAPLYLELEASFVETYFEGIRKLRESDDPWEHLNVLRQMFESLGESHSGSNGVKWAKEVISMYRNLGNIFMKVSTEHSFISEIASDYSGVESLREALRKLKGIEKILKEFRIDDSELEDRLKKARQVESLERL